MSKPTGRPKLCSDERIIELWKQGLNMSQIGRQTDLTTSGVRRRLSVLGLYKSEDFPPGRPRKARSEHAP